MDGDDADAFDCHRCGSCCTSLDTAWDEASPEAGALGSGPVHRLPTPGGLRVFAWEAKPFDEARLRPLLVVPDTAEERLVAAAYELEASTCPRFDEDERACTIYDERPLVCRAYPLLVVPGETGPRAAVSASCPGRVELAEAALASQAPEQALTRLYPDEAPAALAAPVAVRVVGYAVDLLETVGALDAARGLDADTLEAWGSAPVTDLVEIAEEVGVADRDTFRDRMASVRESLRERWAHAATS